MDDFVTFTPSDEPTFTLSVKKEFLKQADIYKDSFYDLARKGLSDYLHNPVGPAMVINDARGHHEYFIVDGEYIGGQCEIEDIKKNVQHTERSLQMKHNREFDNKFNDMLNEDK